LGALAAPLGTSLVRFPARREGKMHPDAKTRQRRAQGVSPFDIRAFLGNLR
jgi:hypothetical protein